MLFIVLTPLIVVSLLCARFSTAYSSRHSHGKYITVKNKVIAKLLIERMNFWNHFYVTEKDRNKMSLAGLIFYIANAVLIILTIVLREIPTIPCNPFEIEIEQIQIVIGSYNALVPIVCFFLLIVVEFMYQMIYELLHNDAKTKIGKWAYCVCCSFVIILCIISIIGTVYLFVTW